MKSKNKKQIVFYFATHPFELVYKIAYILRKNGYETILAAMCEKDRFDHKFYSEAFDRVICSNFQFFKPSFRTLKYNLKRSPDLIKFLISIKLLNPDLVIGISGVNWQLKLIHKYFFKNCSFIYFPYDILSHSFVSKQEALANSPPKFEIEAEKYCFENSDGIIHKGHPEELNFLEGIVHDKINVSRNQLSWLPYCSNEFIVPINKNKLSKKDKHFHIVVIGSFSNDPMTKKSLFKFLEHAFKQKIHLHFYVKVPHLLKEEEEKYIDNIFGKAYENEFFHLHAPLGPKEIILEISKYDFGVWIPYGKDIPEVKFSMGHKISSYFEAGIPVLYGERAIFLDKLMKSYKTGVSFNEKNLKKLNKRLKKVNYKKLEKNIKKARKDFNFNKNLIRLKGFIEKTINKKKKQ